MTEKSKQTLQMKLPTKKQGTLECQQQHCNQNRSNKEIKAVTNLGLIQMAALHKLIHLSVKAHNPIQHASIKLNLLVH